MQVCRDVLVQQVFLRVSEMLLSPGSSVPRGSMISVVITQVWQLEKLLNYELCMFSRFKCQDLASCFCLISALMLKIPPGFSPLSKKSYRKNNRCLHGILLVCEQTEGSWSLFGLGTHFLFKTRGKVQAGKLNMNYSWAENCRGPQKIEN